MAQMAPTPKKAPRTPVKIQPLTSSKTTLPTSRTLTGKAIIIDNDRIQIDKIEMRLFGVVPPTLSAPYGAQTRTVLDALAIAPVTCHIRDRDREKHLLASCTTEDHLDFGTELLRRGLAITARGTLKQTNLAMTYISAEEAAKAQSLGLWSLKQPRAATKEDISLAAELRKEKQRAEEESKKRKEAEEEIAKIKAEAQQKIQTAEAEKEEAVATTKEEQTPPPVVVALSGEQQSAPEQEEPETEELLAAYQAEPSSTSAEAFTQTGEGKSFTEKYQLLLSSILFLLTALVGSGAYFYTRRAERKEDLRAIAAALRGELMAARSVCLARLAKIAHEGEDRPIKWPRLRAIVFNAYVGQIGKLGADLSRQIASIYGQASDYAAYYVGADGNPEAASKKQSLQSLVHYIEEVVPRLAIIENTGASPQTSRLMALTSSLRTRALQQSRKPKTKAIAHTKPTNQTEPAETPDQNEAEAALIEEPVMPPEARTQEKEKREEKKEPSLSESLRAITEKDEAETANEPAITESEAQESLIEQEKTIETILPQQAETIEPTEPTEPPDSPQPSPRTSLKPAAKDVTDKAEQAHAESKESKPNGARSQRHAEKKPPQKSAKQNEKTHGVKQQAPTHLTEQAKHAAEKLKQHLMATARHVDLKTPLVTGLTHVKAFADDKWHSLRPRLSSSIEDIIPDYANLTEEEIEALAYAEDELFLDSYSEDDRKLG